MVVGEWSSLVLRRFDPFCKRLPLTTPLTLLPHLRATCNSPQRLGAPSGEGRRRKQCTLPPPASDVSRRAYGCHSIRNAPGRELCGNLSDALMRRHRPRPIVRATRLTGFKSSPVLLSVLEKGSDATKVPPPRKWRQSASEHTTVKLWDMANCCNCSGRLYC